MARIVSASMLGLGGIPPTLEALAGVACHRIIRSHVLSFAALRQIRFGSSPEGDAACRALRLGGILALGRTESLVALPDSSLEPVDLMHRLYRRTL